MADDWLHITYDIWLMNDEWWHMKDDRWRKIMGDDWIILSIPLEINTSELKRDYERYGLMKSDDDRWKQMVTNDDRFRSTNFLIMKKIVMLCSDIDLGTLVIKWAFRKLWVLTGWIW